MKFIDKWFFNRWMKARDTFQNGAEEPIKMRAGRHNINTASVSSSSRIQSGGMQFTLHQANGGHILEYNKYDEKTDQSINSLHLITASDDLGQSIGHAITLEMLKR